MKKINVLQVCSYLGLGGIQKSLQIITKYLDRSIFNVSVCVLVPGGVRERAIKEMGIKVYNVDKSPEKFAKLIEDEKIRIVHFHGGEKEFPVFIKAAKEAGALAIILMDVAGKIIDPETSKLIDRHLISKMIALRYKKWYKVSSEEFHKNCRVLYYPIDLDKTKHFKISSDEILRERKKLGMEPNDLVIGGIGRPDISKWGDIVGIISHLIKRVPNVKYLAMGLPELKKMEIRKRNLDKYFVYLSPDPNVAKFYCLIDIFALSSSRGGETFGRTVAEAMSYKKPVVVRSTPLADNAQIELVDNGKTGFVVYSPNAFAEAIAYLASNRAVARRMGLAGYAKVKRGYEAKKITKMLEKRILELLIARGMKIHQKILRKYEKISQFPSRKNIDDFEVEYERRLRDCVGKPDLIKILVGKHVAFSPLIRKFIRSVRFTNFRNTIMRFRERR
ncbi:MAG: glycosyltransferase family 4 protein [Hadesarchaea archaeon]|nr:glycosyltransferase family 4 protein [Hadesarchaea archaeon]